MLNHCQLTARTYKGALLSYLAVWAIGSVVERVLMNRGGSGSNPHALLFFLLFCSLKRCVVITVWVKVVEKFVTNFLRQTASLNLYSNGRYEAWKFGCEKKSQVLGFHLDWTVIHFWQKLPRDALLLSSLLYQGPKNWDGTDLVQWKTIWFLYTENAENSCIA